MWKGERATQKVPTGQDLHQLLLLLDLRVHWTRSQKPGIKSQLSQTCCVIQAKISFLSELLSNESLWVVSSPVCLWVGPVDKDSDSEYIWDTHHAWCCAKPSDYIINLHLSFPTTILGCQTQGGSVTSSRSHGTRLQTWEAASRAHILSFHTALPHRERTILNTP